jgi:hypothetical protein
VENGKAKYDVKKVRIKEKELIEKIKNTIKNIVKNIVTKRDKVKK